MTIYTSVEKNNDILVSMKLNDDLVGFCWEREVRVISRLPLQFALQYKVLCKNLRGRIYDPKFSKTLFQHQKDCSTQLMY